MILIPIPRGFLPGKSPFIRRLAFYGLLTGIVLLLASLPGGIFS